MVSEYKLICILFSIVISYLVGGVIMSSEKKCLEAKEAKKGEKGHWLEDFQIPNPKLSLTPAQRYKMEKRRMRWERLIRGFPSSRECDE